MQSFQHHFAALSALDHPTFADTFGAHPRPTQLTLRSTHLAYPWPTGGNGARGSESDQSSFEHDPSSPPITPAAAPSLRPFPQQQQQQQQHPPPVHLTAIPPAPHGHIHPPYATHEPRPHLDLVSHLAARQQLADANQDAAVAPRPRARRGRTPAHRSPHRGASYLDDALGHVPDPCPVRLKGAWRCFRKAVKGIVCCEM